MEIKFKALTVNENEWVFGSYVELLHHGNGYTMNMPCIVTIYGNREDVQGHSVCQFTGLYDKFGREIYEGDVVRKPHSNLGYGVRESATVKRGVGGGFYLDGETNTIEILTERNASEIQVIGNIYDTRE